jgi:ABC-2 type transport system permease protein
VRLLVAGLRKLVRRPASWVSVGLLAGLLSLILIAVGATAREAATRPNGGAALLLVTFPQAYTLILSFILGLGGLIAVIYGAAIAGSEWNWGTLKSAVARGESRSRYWLLTFASVAVMIGVGLLIAFLVGTLMAVVGATLAGVSTSGLGDSAALGRLPDQLGRSWIAIVEEGAVGFTVATLARSQLAGIGAGIALYFGEQFASIFLPDVVKYFPFNAATAVVENAAGGGAGGIVQRLEPGLALVAVVAWLVGALLVAALFTERAEIAG